MGPNLRCSAAAVLLLGLCACTVVPLQCSEQSAAAATSTAVEALKRCVNDNYDGKATSVLDFERSTPVKMQLHDMWTSSTPHSVNLTVVTTVSSDRLNQLWAQCMSWGGPMVAAMWVPVLREEGKLHVLTEAGRKDLEGLAKSTADFHKRVEASGLCQLDILMLQELVAEELLGGLMPINTLRNYALLAARTPLVAMVDVDLLFSESMHSSLSDPESYSTIQRLAANRAVVVLPAFATRHYPDLAKAQALAEHAVSVDKQTLKRKLVDHASVHWFQQHDYKWGHIYTNYEHWYDPEVVEPYQVRAGNGYEPWFIVDRRLNSFYDQRFRGYGFDKISHVLYTNATGFKFMIHPNGFIVHRQHPKSKAFWTFVARRSAHRSLNEPRTGYELKRVTTGMWDVVRDGIAAGTYQPLLDSTIEKCSQTLPWWRGWQGGGQLLQQQQQQGATAETRH